MEKSNFMLFEDVVFVIDEYTDQHENELENTWNHSFDKVFPLYESTEHNKIINSISKQQTESEWEKRRAERENRFLS